MSETKTCTRCEECKGLSEFSSVKGSPGRLYPFCKQCNAARAREYYRARGEAYRAATARWRAANTEHVKKYEHNYSVANKSKNAVKRKAHYEANKPRILAHHAEWKRANAAHCASYENGRRALKEGSAVEPIDKLAIFERDNWTCYLCMKPVDRDAPRYQADSPVLEHLIAISRGGAHVASNVACAHWSCNASKHDKSWYYVLL